MRQPRKTCVEKRDKVTSRHGCTHPKLPLPRLVGAELVQLRASHRPVPAPPVAATVPETWAVGPSVREHGPARQLRAEVHGGAVRC